MNRSVTRGQETGGASLWALRGATAGDVDAIARVWHAGWGDRHRGHVPPVLYRHPGLEALRERVPARLPTTTVATVASLVVGFVVAVDDEIEQLYVAAAARGSGVAAALLAHGERIIAETYDLPWLAVVAGNARACRFYQRHGWRDASAIDYLAETAGGPVPLPSRRYEKQLKR